MTLAVLGPYDLVAVVLVLAFVYGLARLKNRRVTLGFGKGRSITIEDIHSTVKKIEETVGEANGEGPVTKMLEDIRAEQRKVKAALEAKLDERTHVLRAGATEPEELGPYMQKWFHDINGSLTVIYTALSILWRRLEPHYDLPPIPSLIDLEPKESND